MKGHSLHDQDVVVVDRTASPRPRQRALRPEGHLGTFILIDLVLLLFSRFENGMLGQDAPTGVRHYEGGILLDVSEEGHPLALASQVKGVHHRQLQDTPWRHLLASLYERSRIARHQSHHHAHQGDHEKDLNQRKGSLCGIVCGESQINCRPNSRAPSRRG